jgi:hypothetical protein
MRVGYNIKFFGSNKHEYGPDPQNIIILKSGSWKFYSSYFHNLFFGSSFLHTQDRFAKFARRSAFLALKDRGTGRFYSGRGKFMPVPLKSKILETPGFLVTDYIKMFPL